MSGEEGSLLAWMVSLWAVASFAPPVAVRAFTGSHYTELASAAGGAVEVGPMCLSCLRAAPATSSSPARAAAP